MSSIKRTQLIVIVAGVLVLGGVGAWFMNSPVILAALPYLLLLACPLSMIYMMRGMGHGSMSASDGHHDGAPEATHDLGGLPRDERVHGLRHELARMAWRQEALRHELDDLERQTRGDRVVDADARPSAR